MFYVGAFIIVNVLRVQFWVLFIYMTYLNLILITATMFFGAVLATLNNSERELERKSLKIYWVMWNHSMVVACIVSVSYWILLYEGQPVDFNNIFTHAINSIILLVDLFISDIPSSNKNVIFPTFTVVIYAIFTLVYQLAGGLD
jgi:hypothetical protein